MPGFQPLGLPRLALGCEAGVGDEAGNADGPGFDAVVIAAVFAVGAGTDDGIDGGHDGLVGCLGRGTGVGLGAGANGLVCKFCR